jgi:GalNAc5-diNAcBac-PP-undecaprenol beta-1,3-glucosyltransferase
VSLPFAIASVQAQGIDDIEMLIVGDVVNNAPRATAELLRADDARIRFFDFPKGSRKGEIHRDLVLQQASGSIVCYQADDDLWLSGHLETMEVALEAADLVGSVQAHVSTEGWAWGRYFDLERSDMNSENRGWRANPMALARERARASGWRSRRIDWTPAGGCRRTGRPRPTAPALVQGQDPALPASPRFPELHRRRWTDQQRAAELEHWKEIIQRPDGPGYPPRARGNLVAAGLDGSRQYERIGGGARPHLFLAGERTKLACRRRGRATRYPSRARGNPVAAGLDGSRQYERIGRGAGPSSFLDGERTKLARRHRGRARCVARFEEPAPCAPASCSR